MAKPIIEIENISKKYNIGHREPYYSFRDQIAGLFSGKKQAQTEEFWALKDINLEIEKGDAIGIIGRNGAGKSTLLKILSQITPPTTGKITMRGRVASLLEVGTGFNPELTGRENIFLNGAILGMTQNEIKRKFDDIVAFSEIEKFLDTPVKRYSSGMYVRLAFSVAAHLEPEILIVDEVLAVGDAQFQKKCLGKMSEAGESGRTVIFVSHNMATIKSLCKKCFLLDKGKILAQGETDKVLDVYLSGEAIDNNGVSDLSDSNLRRNSSDNSRFKFDKIAVLNSNKMNIGSIRLFEPFDIVIEGRQLETVDDFSLAFDIKSSIGVVMFNSIFDSKKLFSSNEIGKKRFAIQFSVNYLPPGAYTVGISANGGNVLDWIPNAISFYVEPVSKDSTTLIDKFDGVVVHPHKWISLN